MNSRGKLTAPQIVFGLGVGSGKSADAGSVVADTSDCEGAGS